MNKSSMLSLLIRRQVYLELDEEPDAYALAPLKGRTPSELRIFLFSTYPEIRKKIIHQ
ncbi:MAG: hypothetical protein HXS45_07830 [Theionarchaea archaeon]|nr:hypothetical protein [Theionarchaea archaeon]